MSIYICLFLFWVQALSIYWCACFFHSHKLNLPSLSFLNIFQIRFNTKCNWNPFFQCFSILKIIECAGNIAVSSLSFLSSSSLFCLVPCHIPIYSRRRSLSLCNLLLLKSSLLFILNASLPEKLPIYRKCTFLFIHAETCFPQFW